jgi:HemY protein
LDAFQWQTPVASLPSDKTAVIESSPFEDAMLAAPPPPRARLVNQGQGDPGQIDQGQINQGQGDRIDRGQIDKGPVEPPRVIVPEVILEPATQDNLPPAINVEPKAEIEAENSPAPAVESDTGPAVESKPSEPAASVAAPAAKAAAKTSNKPAEPVPVAPPEPAPPPESLPASMGPAPLFRTRTDLGKPASAPIPAVIPILRAPDDPGIDDEAPVDEFTEKIGTSRAQAGGWRGFLSRWGG